MANLKKYIITLTILPIIILELLIHSFYTNFLDKYYIISTYILLAITVTTLIININKKFLFLEFLSIIPIIQWLLGFTITYQMGLISNESYLFTYEYLLFGTMAYILGLNCNWSVGKIDTKISDKDILKNIELNLKKSNPNKILLQFLLGVFSLLSSEIAHVSIKYILQIIASYFFISTLKFMMSKYKIRLPIILTAIAILLQLTLFQGMLGTIVFWSISTFLLLNINLKINYLKLIPVFSISVYLLLCMYSAKMEYRAQTWKIKQFAGGREGSRTIQASPQKLLGLIGERIVDPNLIFSKESLLGMTDRINQSLQVLYVMRRVPKTEPFTNGEMTIVRPISALIPRIFWEKKPILPDPKDYQRFTGFTLTKYNSVTIGPIGEAYADFGKLGPLFLFFYGLIMRLLYKYFRKKSEKNSFLILWFLVIMSTAISHTETTVSGSLNGYLKLLIFISIIHQIGTKNKSSAAL